MTWRARLQALCVVLLGIICCVALGLYVFVHWTERQVLTVDNWVALVSPLPKQQVVSEALGRYVSGQIFAADTVKQKVADALPPKAAFLAAPLTAQLQSLTTRAAQRLVAGDVFQTIWAGANRVAMNRIVGMARGQAPPLRARAQQRFDVDISDAREPMRKALGSTATALPALQPAHKQLVAVSVDLQARANRWRQLVRTIDWVYAVLPWLIVSSALGMVALSRHRRRAMIRFAWAVIGAMLLELIGLKWARQEVLDHVHVASNSAAVSYIYDTVLIGLKQAIYWVLFLGALLLVGLLLAGPAPWMVALRSYVHISGFRHTALYVHWLEVREWARHFEVRFCMILVGLTLVALVLADSITSQTIAIAFLVLGTAIAFIHLVATPRTHKSL